MTAALSATLAVLVGVTMLPALLTNGDPPALAVCGIDAGPTSVVLATIRTLESGGDYTAQAAGSTASGAYQFLNSTWNQYGGYTRAADAPPDVQDAKAAELVASILEQHHGDVAAVPVVWYIGHVPAIDSAEWDTVPHPNAGNTLTPRQYQTRWLTKHDELLTAAPTDTADDQAAAPAPGSCFGRSITALDGEWALPGPRELIDANPNALTAPHHDYPAWDWIIPTNTPIYAVRGGTVISVKQWAHNWWAHGCGRDSTGCQTCGVGITITDPDGNRWTYCHGTDLTTTLGTNITAGQQIMWSGNTGRSGTPHLHLELRTPDNQRHCPQPILDAIAGGSAPVALPSTYTCWF